MMTGDTDTKRPTADELRDEVDARLDQTIGAYRIVRLIGSGGMGNVFLARRADGQFEQEVALKLVKRGMDTDHILRRFRAERQILADLQHPNVCRLLDGGASDDGLPYFVMEHIDGEPIDRWCRWREAPVARRLELVIALCGAVRTAHQRLIVHCDIKPKNVLVGEDGVPKLVDFGIARMLGEPRPGTQSGFLTPAYASPEQVRGQPITTATDVHALGLLLYELLSGRHPFVSGATDPEAVSRAVVGEDPPLPSKAAETPALARALRGDLDTIVMRALRKDPAERYPSASELAADLERHLGGRPVLARPQGLAYRAGKLLRRHKLAAAAALAVFVSLVAGLGATLWQARVAHRERARAERRFAEARRLSNALVFDVYESIREVPGTTGAQKLLIERAAAYLDGLAADVTGDASLQRDLAMAYRKLGDVQGNPSFANHGDFTGARGSYRKGLAIVDPLVVREPGDRASGVLRAELLDALGRTLWATGSYDEALEQMRQALAQQERVLRDHPGDTGVLRGVAGIHADMAQVLTAAGHPDAAVPELRGALERFRAIAAGGGGDARILRGIPVLLKNLGDLQLATGDAAGALPSFEEALLLSLLNQARAPNNAVAQADLLASVERVGKALLALGDTAGALALFEVSLAGGRAAVAADPDDARARQRLMGYLSDVGSAYVAARACDRATAYLREGLAVAGELRVKAQLHATDEGVVKDLEKDLAGCAAR